MIFTQSKDNYQWYLHNLTLNYLFNQNLLNEIHTIFPHIVSTLEQFPQQKFSLCNLFTTLESPTYSNSNFPNLFLWFFCLIRSRANSSGITQPFLNLNLIFASNCLLQNQYKNSKQRFGGFEFEYFGGSDVATKLNK